MNTPPVNRTARFAIIALLFGWMVGPGVTLPVWGAVQPTPQAPSSTLPAKALIPLSNGTTISASSLHTCLLTRDGTVRCWGDNSHGELGDGTTETRYTPVDVVGLTGDVRIITAGVDHTCALMTEGGVWCWGNNYNGQLGDGTTEDRLLPVGVVGLTEEVTAIAAGSDHTCAVTASGNVKCWGFNAWGLTGEGSTDRSSTPMDLNGLVDVTAITAGENHTCALTGGGGVKCWGATGTLGVASFDNGPVTATGLTEGVTAIAAGAGHTCAVKGEQALCWGANGSGQLGNGAQTTVELMPVEVSGLSGNIVALSAGMVHTCALLGDGGVQCWGGNSLAQLGDGTTTLRTTPVPVNGLGGQAVAIASGYVHTCALFEKGNVECWGLQRTGLLGDGILDPSQNSPVKVSGLDRKVAAIGSGQTTSCVALQTGGVKCWGLTDSFLLATQIAEGASVNSGAPLDVAGLTDAITALAVGDDHTCALVASGGVVCWGSNGQGQLGDGTIKRRESFVSVSGLSHDIAALAAGADHTCAVIAGGGVRCWGNNTYGQLGDGTTEDRAVPVDVVGLASGVAAITAGSDHTCALKSDGGVQCWGNNNFGRLGNGASSGDDSSIPVEVTGLSDSATAVAAGDAHTCAALAGGGVQCWGRNSDGELGDGTTDYRDGPVLVSGLSGAVTHLTAGRAHTCGLTDGGAVCWGDNAFGQLGDDSAADQMAPVNVRGLSSGVVAIAAGAMHTCALTQDGAVWCWGNNEFGQLGDDTLVRKTPGPVLTVDHSGFRSPDILVPELTTHIPTPLDVSTSPPVMGANLLLAGAAMILFTIASELLNNLLAENEAALQKALRPARWLGLRIRRFEARLGAWLRYPHLLDMIRVGGLVLFYGLVFSLLQRGWNPISVTGLYLFFIMAMSFGLVGLADEVAKWNTARRWGISTSLSLRPANLVLAVASTSFSRLFGLIPGLMFGTPEAFEVDRKALTNRQEVKLLAVGSGTILVIGLGVWLFTIVTTLLQRAALPGALTALIGGVESLLLILFAVAVQNAFLQTLALPDSYGRALLKWNRWVWAGVLLSITFLFYHTLINPRGELATALNAANVRFFFITILAFLFGTLAMWLYFKWGGWRAARRKATTAAATPIPAHPDGCEQRAEPQAETTPREPPIPAAVSQTTATPLVAPAYSAKGPKELQRPVESPRPNGKGAVVVESTQALATVSETTLPADSKPCPMCGKVIKAEARLCRYCRATFEIVTKGYCLTCHAVVEADGDRCRQCGREVVDRHIESLVLTKPAPLAAQPVLPTASPTPQPVTKPARKRVPWWWVLGIMLVLGLGGLAMWTGALWFASNSAALPIGPVATNTAKPTMTPSPRPTLAPTSTSIVVPTRTPRLVVTPTQVPPSTITPTPFPAWVQDFAEPILAAIASRVPDFQDDFSTRAGGWTLEEWCAIRGRLEIENGEMTVSACRVWREIWYPDFVAEVDARFLPGAPPGSYWNFFYRHRNIIPSDSPGYTFYLNGDVDADVIGIEENTRLQGVALPGADVNHVLLIAKGQSFALYLNDRPVFYMLGEATWPNGGMRLSIEDAVAFDNFRVWDISDLTVAP